jgi:hypothetical protein
MGRQEPPDSRQATGRNRREGVVAGLVEHAASSNKSGIGRDRRDRFRCPQARGWSDLDFETDLDNL